MDRKTYLSQISRSFKVNRIVALLGPRQCGKTTLAQNYIETQKKFPPENYFDLENPRDLARLEEPLTALEHLEGLIIIDEIQRKADLFPTLRYLHDYHPKQHYLILGSASRDLIKQSSESLAGRISYLEVTPFQGIEALTQLDKLWLRGGFPRSFLGKNDEISFEWRQNYIKTFVEQDIPSLGFTIPAERIRKFWAVLAHYHGQICNYSELGTAMGLSGHSIKSYMELLSGTFMIRLLHPWFENIKKRQIKTPKIYFRDAGLYHYFLDIESKSHLLTNPKIGASWEGFALENIIQRMAAEPQDCYFWGVHNQAELDLLIHQRGQKWGFEIKYQDAPKLTSSMKMAMEALDLDKLIVIYPGTKNYPLAQKVEVMGLRAFLENK